MRKIIGNLAKILLLLVLLVTTCVILARPTTADVGYHSSYSGGSSSSSSSSYSSGSWTGGSDSSSGSSYSSSYGSLSTESTIKIFVGILIYMAIGITIIIIKNLKGKHTEQVNLMRQSESNTKSVEEKVKQVDPLFSADKFMKWGSEVFVKLQTAWMNRTWEDIRTLESTELFEQHKGQLQYLIDNKQINMMKNIRVEHTQLTRYRKDGDKEVLVMILRATMRDYIIEEESNKIVQGSPNKDIQMLYSLTFVRKAGVKTMESNTEYTNTISCPNCGAPTKITSSGKCEYCGSIITTGEHGWVLDKLEGYRSE